MTATLNGEPHEMFPHSRDESGRILWKCTVCTRKLIMRSEPFEKFVLEEGEENTPHVGSTVPGMKIGTSLIPYMSDEVSDEDLAFLREAGIEWDKED